jgi:hypothetical protein
MIIMRGFAVLEILWKLTTKEVTLLTALIIL